MSADVFVVLVVASVVIAAVVCFVVWLVVKLVEELGDFAAWLLLVVTLFGALYLWR